MGNEEGHEAPRDEGCRRGGTRDEGNEEGHEAPCDEGCRRGRTRDEGHEGNESHEGNEEGHEGNESDEGHEGHEEGNESDEGHEGHEGNEEVKLQWWLEVRVLSVLQCHGHERCFVASSRGGVPRQALVYKH